MSRNKKIILAANLLVLLVVLTRFLSIKTPFFRISFAFLPTMICATYLGWKWTICINVIADFAGAILFPSGAYFVGYTLSAALSGLIYGLLLYQPYVNSLQKQSNWFNLAKIITAVILVTLIVHAGLNSLWLSLTTDKAFIAISSMRIAGQLIMVPVQVVTYLFAEKVLHQAVIECLYDNEDSRDDCSK